jgi:hypothetical protein
MLKKHFSLVEWQKIQEQVSCVYYVSSFSVLHPGKNIAPSSELYKSVYFALSRITLLSFLQNKEDSWFFCISHPHQSGFDYGAC